MGSLRRCTIPARGRPRALAALAIAFALGAGVPAAARVVVAPWGGNIAFVSSQSTAGGVVDLKTQSPPGPAAWSGTPISEAHNDTTDANAFAMMALATSFGDSIFAVSSNGFAVADGPATSNRGGALVYVQFVIERTQSYVSYPVFSAGNFGSSHTLAFLANMQSEQLAVVPLLPGETTSGRLAPGSYSFYFESYYRDEPDNGSPDNASTQVGFYEVPDPLIAQHPQNQTVPPGGSASFAVGASGSPTPSTSDALVLAYQWRRDYQNLSDGGRISGAMTNQLHIDGVVAADSGVYDCVVTQGPVQEPSSLARLTVTGGVTGVEDAPQAAGLALSTPAPNPFGSRTLVRFTLPGESDVTLDVLDVGGRRVRSLLRGERRSAGAYALEWDGRSDGGARAASGIYFVRLLAGPEQRIRRVARIAP
jgi:hypothetical protein